jgi:leader peptidase (prepilin peptidase) / N-methyltransferase
MPSTVVLLTSLIAALAALGLTPFMRQVAATDSAWLGSGLHSLLAGCAGAGAAILARGWAELIAFALLGLACAMLAVIDLAAYRLPDVIVGPMYPILFICLGVAAGVSGDWGRLGRTAAASGVLLLGYLVLAVISPSNLGFGDVKLAGLLGAFLGWLGWSNALLGTLVAFTLSGLVASVLVLAAGANRRTAFPFGPWMIVGAAVGACFGPAVLGTNR